MYSSMRQKNIKLIAIRRSLSSQSAWTMIPSINHNTRNLPNHHKVDIKRSIFSTCFLSSPSPTTTTTTTKNRINNDRDINYDGVLDEETELINDHVKKLPTSVSLEVLLRTGRAEYLDQIENVAMKEHTATELVLIQVASFLRRELPIRLAHRVQDLEKVPLMKDMKSVKEVKQLYIQSFLELLEFEKKIVSADQEEAFSRLVEGIYERHSRVLVQMARGAYEFRHHIHEKKTSIKKKSNNNKRVKDVFAKMEETHAFLDRFYLCRIGIRVLIGQYLALRQPHVDHYVGIICSVTSPYEIVKRAIDDAAFMCTRKYGDAPEVIMSGRLDLTFPYDPTHLHYIMLELLKNSMRATVEWHGPDADYPPIKVIIADGSDNEDVVIKVSDEGGGIPRSNVKKIWSYLFTTADPSIQEGLVGVVENEAVDHGIDSPLAGLGYGLPISRSYCRYFGGDLSIMSMEGYGTDAFVYLARPGDTKEPVPI